MLHLIDTGGPGGAETIFLHLVNGLSRFGWDNVPVVPEAGWLSEALQECGHHPIVLRSDRAFDAGYLVRLRRMIRELRIDLVQTHLLTTSVYSSAASLGTPIPVVSTFHGLPDVGPDSIVQRVKAGLIARPRNRFVFVSRSLADALTLRLGISHDRSVVIHNGIDLDAFAPGARGWVRDRFDVDAGTPLLGAVGNVRGSKAYDVMLRAFVRIREAVPAARLVIAGQAEGELFESLRSLAVDLRVAEAVDFAGFVEDVPGFLADLDVFVLSSSDEGFSLATTQAMASGLPVVATRCGGPEEILQDGAEGVLVPVGDDQALAEAVLSLLGDPGLARRLGRGGRSAVEGRFSVDAMVERYSELYARCLGA